MKASTLARTALAMSLVAAGTSAIADESQHVTSSASLSFTSDYLFRGVSQSSGTAAVQGGITISHDSGAYVGLWGSSIAFAQGLELDPSIGFANSVGEVSYDVSVVHYGYPGYTDEHLPFTELKGSVSWKGATAGVAWTDNYYGDTGKAIYTYLGYGTSVAGVGLSLKVGRSDFDDEQLPVADEYVDYSVGVSKTLAGFNLGLAYIDSSLDDSECATFTGGSPHNCSGRAVFTLSKSL